VSDQRRLSTVARCRSYGVPVEALTESAIDQMWRLFSRHYEAEGREAFVRSLMEKDTAFLVVDRDSGSVVGFVSVLVIGFERYRAVHFGDTMLDPDYWGAGKLLGLQVVKWLTRRYLVRPHVPLYLVLISSGYKTYLMMVRNVIEFYPTWRRPTPAWAAEVIEEVARHRYGTAFQRETGVLTFPYRRKPLLPWVAPVTDDDRKDRDIAYFLRANPRGDRGDELACLGVVDLRMLWRTWWKFGKIVARAMIQRAHSR
jgi:hypothetical protein